MSRSTARATNGLDVDGPVTAKGTVVVTGTQGVDANTLSAPSIRMLSSQGPAQLVTKRQADLKAQDTLPDGTICMFYGDRASVPAGWKICDGGKHTPAGTTYTGEQLLNYYPSGPNLPDFRNRFPLGVDMGEGDAAAATRSGTMGKEFAADAEGHTRRLTQLPLHSHGMEIKGTGSTSGATSVLIPSIKSSEVQAGRTDKISTGVAVQPSIVASPGGAPGATDSAYGSNHRHKDIGSTGKPTPDPYGVEPRNRKLYYIIKVKQ